MRVALLSYRSKPHCGGQGVYVRHLSRELVRLGHDVEVFSGQPYPELDDGVRLTKVPSLDLYREPDPFRIPRPREFRDLASDRSAAPTPLREFRRTERLIIRVPGTDADGGAAAITATLLNRWRQPMRDVDAMPERWGTTTQFDLPLAGLAPGEYTLRVSIAGPSGSIAEHITFKVLG